MSAFLAPRPKARSHRLLIEAVGDELIVYDQDGDRAHRLNASAALVFRTCDGDTDRARMADLLRARLGLPADEGLVTLALERLEKARLLEEVPAATPATTPAAASGLTRRELVQRLQLSGALALLLPVVTSMSAPTPAMAASGNAYPSYGGKDGKDGKKGDKH